MKNVKCDHLCGVDGQYSKISVLPQREQICEDCPPNHYSIDGGFIVDALMDDESNLDKKIFKHFSVFCESLNLNS